jgi:diacylglycerol O-acyltransferase
MSESRLSPLDCAFLHIEDRATRMQLAGLLTFEGPVPAWTEVREAIRLCLPDLPRFRQRLALSPLGLTAPRWVDDETFDLDYHLHRVVLPFPGGDREVVAHIDHLTAVPLDLQRPLWEISLVEGLSDGRWALSLKVHHAMVDGLSIMDIFAALFSMEAPGAGAPAPAPVRPASTAVAVRVGRSEPPRLDVMEPLRRLARAGQLCGQAPTAVFNRGVAGPTRRSEFLTIPLSTVQGLRKPYGATVNHVVLAVVSGALRRYLERHGEPLEPLFAFVPVNARPDAERGRLGNQIAMTYPELPVHVAQPAARVRAVMESVAATGQQDQAGTTAALMSLGRFLPQPVAALVNRSIQFDGGLFNLTVTNVPGPPVPVYFLDRKLVRITGSTPLTQRHGLTIAVLSYDGELTFSVTTDPARVPDVEGLVADLEAEVEALAEATQSLELAP